MWKQIVIQLKYICLNLAVSIYFGILFALLRGYTNILPEHIALNDIVNWVLVLIVIFSGILSTYLYLTYKDKTGKLYHWVFLLNLSPAFAAMLFYILLNSLMVTSVIMYGEDCGVACL